MIDLTVQQSVKAEIYVENLYEGDLANESLAIVESISWVDWLQVWLESLSLTNNLVQNCEMSLRLTSDRQIRELNQQYRSLDQPTDVLAFAATESAITLPTDFTEPLYLGDIIISLDTAAKQATEQKHSLTVELAWLASHGLLHLLGWDHPDDRSLEQMLQRQSELIQLLALERND
jgi:probable rRNA maturation factor